MNKDVECPYCLKWQEVDHDDGYGYGENETYQQDCDSCEKTFTYTTEISFSYEAGKAPCLNGGVHEWKKTHTFPAKYTDMECSCCNIRRQPTKEEWSLINEETRKGVLDV
jgi:glutaredoxin